MRNICLRGGGKKYPYMYLYAWMTRICLCMVVFHVWMFGGGALSNWFFHDAWDTGNDFFNCIPAVKGYGLGYWLVGQYPPLAKLFFLVMARIYSYENIPLEMAVRNSMTDPRMQQAGLVMFLILVLYVAAAVLVLVLEMYDKEIRTSMAGVSVLGTYSFLYAVERGNIILLSFVFLMYFIVFYRSESRLRREAALIALALSAGLKLYPAAFGILLLYERRWKDAVRAVLYGALVLAVPYRLAGKFLPENEVDSTINSVIEWAGLLVERLFDGRPTWHQIFFAAAMGIALAKMFHLGIIGGKYWVCVFYAGVLAMLCGMQFEYQYTYVFLIPAMFVFFRDVRQINRKNIIYFFLFCILELPLPIFGGIIGEMKMWAVFVMMILVAVLETPMVRKGGVAEADS